MWKPCSRQTRRFLLVLAGTVAVALLLRLWVSAELSSHPTVCRPPDGTDMATYRQLALQILEGRLPDIFYYQPLYYAIFLPCIFFFTGAGPWGVIIAQCLVGAASVWLTGLVGARLFGRRAGLLAAALLALSRVHIFYTPYLLLEVLSGFWLILTVWLSLRAYDRNRLRDWFWCGVGLCAAVLTRGNAVLLAPVILWFAFWRNRRAGWKPITLRALLFVAVLYLPQLPFALHNYARLDRWTGPSTAEEAVLALGNTPESPAGGLEYPMAYQEWMRQAQLPGDQRVPVVRQILQWILREPGAWLELKCRMLVLFWDRVEIPNNIVYEYEARTAPVLELPVLLDFVILGSFGFTGLLLSLRRVRHSAPRGLLLGAFVAGWLATVLFYILGRFRVPQLPFIAIFGGVAVEYLVQTLSQHAGARLLIRRGLLFLGAFCCAYLLVCLASPLYAAHGEKTMLRLVRPYGVVLPMERLILCHDHGAGGAYSGWARFDLPGEGCRLMKEIRLPHLPGVDLRRRAVVMRLPVLAPEGGRLRITSLLQGKTRHDGAFDLKAGGQITPLFLDLGELAPVPDRIRVEVTLTPEGGAVATLMDTHRDYGRTVLFTPDGKAQRLHAEWCAEIVLLPPGAASPAR